MKKNTFNKIIALLLIFVLLGSLFLSLGSTVLAAEDPETIYIDTAEELVELAGHCTLDTWSQGKKVVLRADISLSDVEFSTIPIFGGEFDGNGHTISGLQITQSITPSGLFAILQENAVVKNLKVSGSVKPSGNSSNVGGIVGENYGLVTGCTFTGNVSGGSNVGGIVGINAVTGQVLECSVSGSVIGDKMTGGVAGCNLGIIGECQNSAYVNTVSVDPAISPNDINIYFSLDVSKLSSMDTSMTSSDTGGIAGYSSGIVSGCVNNSPIGYPHIGYNIGGIVGRNCGYIHTCENSADIFGRKDVGGIAGQMEPYIAQNITESTLSKLESQLDELDALLDTALNDANAGVGTVTSRLNKIADYMDSAAGAASDIKTYGNVNSTVTGSGESDSVGGVTVTPPQVEVGGSTETSGGAGVAVTPGGGTAGGGVSSSGEAHGGLTEGSAEGGNHTSASGNVSASTQIAMTTSLSGLSSAIYGMSGQMRLLNGEISGTSGTLTEDMKAIQKQISAISDTAMELFTGDSDGDLMIDSSEIDIDLVTLGKASDCKNHGSVNGDINVGGITGAMAMEYELDPEDDIASNLDGTQRRKFEVKAIIQDCVNTGKIVAKRSYAGGICGRMDLGLIAHSEGYGSVTSESGDYVGGIAGATSSTIRQSFAKCTLSGGDYVGGIVGSGVTEDLSGNSSTVAGCYSMVDIKSCNEYAGAVSGANAGNFVENFFVSDTLAGINGRSYTGKAEPIAYADLLKIAGSDAETAPASESAETTEADASGETETISIPDAFMQLSLTFTADDEIIKTIPFDYGDSFDETVYPEIPQKDGYYSCWDRPELNELHFDTVVNAVYTPYVSALSNTETRTNGRPIFFIEGQFDDEVAATVTTLPNTPNDFDFLATDWMDILLKSFSGTTVSREIVEQWKISIPDDGQRTHTVRYLSPDADPEHLDIYVKGTTGWKKADTEIIGSYLTFSVDRLETEIAVISTVDVWWIWLIAGVLILIVLVLIIRLIRKIVKSKRRAPGKTESEDEYIDDIELEESGIQTVSSRAAPKKKRRWLMPLLIVLALLVGIGGTAAFFLLPDLLDDMKAYELLKKYSEKQELTMELTVEADLGSQDFGFTALLDRTDVDGHRVTAISQDEISLYYCDGAVFLESGNAYKLSGSFPDYSQLLDQTMKLYRYVDIEEKNGTYTITAENADAKAILELLIPSATEMLSDTDSIKVELLADGDEISEIHFSGSGAVNAEKTPFNISAVLRLDTGNQSRIQIPQPVRDAVTGGEYEATEILSDDLIRIANAYEALNQAEFLSAKMLLKADCGPVTLDDSLDFYTWNYDGTQISSIQKNGYALYFTDTAVCNKDGNVISAADATAVESAKLLDIAYQTCLNADLDCSETDGNYVYTLSLDEEGMEAVAYAIAPAAEGMDILFDNGSLQVVICNDKIQSISFCCSGNVQIVLSKAAVSFEAQLEFTENETEVTIPEAVKKALEK
ncbi:MAG: hypothetical protein ACI3VB_04690 [Oscillospiraceae bacterium]